jgi:hypothetical protein
MAFNKGTSIKNNSLVEMAHRSSLILLHFLHTSKASSSYSIILFFQGCFGDRNKCGRLVEIATLSILLSPHGLHHSSSHSFIYPLTHPSLGTRPWRYQVSFGTVPGPKDLEDGQCEASGKMVVVVVLDT